MSGGWVRGVGRRFGLWGAGPRVRCRRTAVRKVAACTPGGVTSGRGKGLTQSGRGATLRRCLGRVGCRAGARRAMAWCVRCKQGLTFARLAFCVRAVVYGAERAGKKGHGGRSG